MDNDWGFVVMIIVLCGGPAIIAGFEHWQDEETKRTEMELQIARLNAGGNVIVIEKKEEKVVAKEGDIW